MFSSLTGALHLVLAELFWIHLLEQFGPFVLFAAFGRLGSGDRGLREDRLGYQDPRAAAQGQCDGVARTRVHAHALAVPLDVKEGEVRALADVRDLYLQKTRSRSQEDRFHEVMRHRPREFRPLE